MDKFHKNDSRLFRAMEHRVQADHIFTASSTSSILAETMKEEMPEVELAVQSSSPQEEDVSVDEKNFKISGRYASHDFFKMFSYDLVQGDKDHVLQDKNSIVISENMALRLFSTTEGIVGKTIIFERKFSFQVSGIFKDVSKNSSEQFDWVISFEKYKEGRDWLKYWGNTNSFAYVLLRPDVDLQDFNKKIAGYINTKTNNEVTYRTLFLKKYSNNYLYGTYENGVLTGGRITYVKLFSAVAVFILVIACINFMNLSTAKASRRIKEVGIKKAVGASRRVLAVQYLGESLFMSFLSLLLAILIVDLSLPQFNNITGKQLLLTIDLHLLYPAILIALFTGLLAGSYPALYLSSFNASEVMRGKLNASMSELLTRKGLVVFQFALSILFIVCVVVVYKQMEFIQSTSLGYNKENVIYFPLTGTLRDEVNQESIISEIKNVPGVINASSLSHDMTGHNSGTNNVVWEGKNPDDKTSFENMTVNFDMIETLDIDVIEGRSFSRDFTSDTASIIFNETAVEFMGLDDPVGKTIKLWDKDMKIVGVTRDFHFESLHENVKPLFFIVNPHNTYWLMARLEGKKLQQTLSRLQALYQKFNPGFLFDYQFVDEEYKMQYAAEQRVSILSKYFAVLAILISCLGLFGLAIFTTERRIKEIGIRKVLGSSVIQITLLLSGEFTIIVLMAIVIALPLSFYLASYWLGGFVLKIELQWMYFIGAAFIALITAWITVGYQAIKAARINPARCLKDE